VTLLLAAAMAVGTAPDFVTRVQPRLVKAGCFSGACHGSGSGQGGFKLSLLGYDPEADYVAIVRAYRGRRLNLVKPEDSLLAKKASFQIAHGGGKRFGTDSGTYRMLVSWIAAGAPYGSGRGRRIERLEVAPLSIMAPNVSMKIQLAVRAHFSDGSIDDVTPFALYSSNDDGIAQVSDAGLVTVVRSGETGVTARYMGKFAVARAGLTFAGPVSRASPAGAFIDQSINRKMSWLRLVPSADCTDSEFLRRASLDLAGTLPTAAQARAFVSSPDAHKRAAAIAAMLETEDFANFWTIWLLDLFRTSSKQIGESHLLPFANWLKDRIARDAPFDETVREMLTASGEADANPAVNFLRQDSNPKLLAELATESLMGSRSRCAQCHDHPFDSWTQTQYHQFVSFFVRVNRTETGVRIAGHGEIDHPKTMKPVVPGFPDGSASNPDHSDRRAALAAWLTSPSNAYFARSFANRVWARLMGRGLIEPVDGLSVSNAASHPELLDDLAAHFARSYSLKSLIREITASRAYQRSGVANTVNATDDRFYSRALAAPLGAYALANAISQVTGAPDQFGKLPLGAKASAVFDSQTESYLLDVCGRCLREGSCDAPNPAAGGVRQALHFLNGPVINAKLAAPEGRLRSLRAQNHSPARIAEEFYWAALSRAPTGAELDFWLSRIAAAKDPDAALEDLVWSLLNSRAFVFDR